MHLIMQSETSCLLLRANKNGARAALLSRTFCLISAFSKAKIKAVGTGQASQAMA